MSWVAVGTMVAGAVTGHAQQRDQRKANERFNKGQAEVTRYSPWTGVRGQVQQDNSSELGGALQGGLSGFAFGQGLQKYGGGGDKGMGTMAVNDQQYSKPSSLYDQMKRQNPYMVA